MKCKGIVTWSVLFFLFFHFQNFPGILKDFQIALFFVATRRRFIMEVGGGD